MCHRLFFSGRSMMEAVMPFWFVADECARALVLTPTRFSAFPRFDRQGSQITHQTRPRCTCLVEAQKLPSAQRGPTRAPLPHWPRAIRIAARLEHHVGRSSRGGDEGEAPAIVWAQSEQVGEQAGGREHGAWGSLVCSDRAAGTRRARRAGPRAAQHAAAECQGRDASHPERRELGRAAGGDRRRL